MPPVKRQISPHAARLRRHMTDAKRLLWSKLRGRRLGFKFRSQHSLGPFVADFVCLERKLIVEADGGQHGPEADRPRTAYLRRRGFRILRFWNHDILGNIDGVIETILLILAGQEDPRDDRPASPSPLSAGEEGPRPEAWEVRVFSESGVQTLTSHPLRGRAPPLP